MPAVSGAIPFTKLTSVVGKINFVKVRGSVSESMPGADPIHGPNNAALSAYIIKSGLVVLTITISPSCNDSPLK
mgnify:CR=1 FL=1